MNEQIEKRVQKIYKSEAPELLAILTRILGAHNIDLAQDVLQEAFNKALSSWKKNNIPKNPSAWIITAAKNHAIDTIRSNNTKIKYSDDLRLYLESEWTLEQTIENEFEKDNIKDDQLQMIFMCCQSDIGQENIIPLILRNLCGFSIPAIARALVINESTVKKRLLRTKDKLKHNLFTFPRSEDLPMSMDTVHTVLYLLFNEGFHGVDKKGQAINLDLCQEAIALVNLLVDEPRIANRETLGLFSLMHYQIARVNSKSSTDGKYIPINLQDRSLWDKDYIETANKILSLITGLSTENQKRFELEALIAKEHCSVDSFESTNWELIEVYYRKLCLLTGSPIFELNHAVVMGYLGQEEDAINKVETIRQHKKLKSSHIPFAVLAHLNAKLGNREEAFKFAIESKQKGGTPHEHQLMIEQLEYLLKNN